MTDNVNSPPHYSHENIKCGCGKSIECIDVVRHLNFNLGNAIKYIWRCDHKQAPVEDLKKAIWYLQDEINKRELTINPEKECVHSFGIVCIECKSNRGYCKCNGLPKMICLKCGAPPLAEKIIKEFQGYDRSSAPPQPPDQDLINVSFMKCTVALLEECQHELDARCVSCKSFRGMCDCMGLMEAACKKCEASA